jgi:chromate transporter
MPNPGIELTDVVARPASCWALFVAFTRLALQGFGGVMPVAQRELVERLHWLDRAQFLDLVSMAQVLPGPNVVNLSLMVGNRYFGWRGGLCAMAGMLTLPMLLVLLLAAFYQRWQALPVLAGALRGMGVVAGGLVLATALKLALTLRQNALGLLPCAALGGLTLLAVGALRWPLVWVVLSLGVLGMLLAWRKLPP